MRGRCCFRAVTVSTNRLIVAAFDWTEQRSRAAVALAEGKTQKQVAQEVEAGERTIRDWLANPDFAAEVDRLSLMVGIASRAERLRLAMRVVRERTKGEAPETDRDLLEWLKFAQSETDGIKLSLTAQLAAVSTTETPVADSGSDRDSLTSQSI